MRSPRSRPSWTFTQSFRPYYENGGPIWSHYVQVCRSDFMLAIQSINQLFTPFIGSGYVPPVQHRPRRRHQGTMDPQPCHKQSRSFATAANMQPIDIPRYWSDKGGLKIPKFQILGEKMAYCLRGRGYFLSSETGPENTPIADR